jgi:hypothetical protein
MTATLSADTNTNEAYYNDKLGIALSATLELRWPRGNDDSLAMALRYGLKDAALVDASDR